MNRLEYINGLRDNLEIQSQVDVAITNFSLYCGGVGYGEVIVALENTQTFVKQIADCGVTVRYISFWCHNTARNRKLYGCPHGGGGYQCGLQDEYLSELYHVDAFNMSTEDTVVTHSELTDLFTKYFEGELQHHDYFRPCLALAFFLDVPPHWKREDCKSVC